MDCKGDDANCHNSTNNGNTEAIFSKNDPSTVSMEMIDGRNNTEKEALHVNPNS